MFGRDEKPSQIRLSVVQYLILAIFLFLAYGLWRLQVSQSNMYATLAEQNRIRNVPILAPRGKIIDRNGRTIVDNYRSVTALLLRDTSRDLNSDVPLIATGLHIDPKEVKDKIRRFAYTPQYQPIYLKEDITPDEEAFIEAHKTELPELDTIMAYRRLYPRKGFMAHLIGYVGEVSEDMLNQPQFELYNPGDVVGKSGVELEYNQILMGKNGSRQELVNSHGQVVTKPLEATPIGQGEGDEKPAEPGKPLKLTVDVDLQIAAEEALGDKNGAIVAMDPHTGEILAMVSRPTFDPNDFAVRISRGDWSKLVKDPEKPLLNKAIQAQLAPGSTFKIIMATAGWQEGIAQDMHVHCNGSADFYGRNFKCWVAFEHRTHGDVDLTKAIYQSCDVFFYTLAEKLGIDRISRYATMFGLGQKTGIDLPQEVSGVMPSEEWKLHNFRQKWFAGETISVGIGQGAVAVTPVQLMRAISAISMGGKMVVPHVVDPSGLPSNYLEVGHYTDVKMVPIDPNGWNFITDAMSRVLLPEGTAPSAHIPGIDIAGKTGSAQVVSLATRAKHQNSEDLAQNGWFVGFTPRRNPDIVVCVLFQGGEHGKLAARLATQVIKAFVDKQRRQPVKMVKGSGDHKTEIGALWTAPSGDPDGDGQKLQGGRFVVNLPKKPLPLAMAAPGIR
jgi:penicillin-binding protein 2